MKLPEQDKIAHLPLLDLPYMLKSSRDEGWRKTIRAIAQATANVLADEKLCAADLRSRFQQAGERFRIELGELTPEGFRFARQAYHRWLGNIDRWKGEKTVERLEATLRKQIAAFRKSDAPR